MKLPHPLGYIDSLDYNHYNMEKGNGTAGQTRERTGTFQPRR